jgi:hypothetical protein
MFIAEVVEINKAFKPDQTDEEGNPLPLGSIQIRIGSDRHIVGQVRNVYARPATFNRRIPLIGEQVLIINGPVNDWSTKSTKNTGFMYIAPINGTDDLVLHKFPKLWTRDKTGPKPAAEGSRKSDREEPGYTFDPNPKKVHNIQPFEGDDIYEGRLGHSMRFGSTVEGDMSNYEKKPTWKEGSNGDPLWILRIKKPTGGSSGQQAAGRGKFKSTSRYTIEDLSEDEASIYVTTTQKLPKLTPGFDKNTNVKQTPNWKNGSQVVVDAERLVLNARKDMAFLIAAKELVMTSKKVLLQSENYKVYLDDLMDFIKDLTKLCTDLASGTAQYSTASGPTGPATNMGDFIKLNTADFQKFKMP